MEDAMSGLLEQTQAGEWDRPAFPAGSRASPCQALDGEANKPSEKAADTLQPISLNLVHFPLP